MIELNIAVKEMQAVQHNGHFHLYTWFLGFTVILNSKPPAYCLLLNCSVCTMIQSIALYQITKQQTHNSQQFSFSNTKLNLWILLLYTPFV